MQLDDSLILKSLAYIFGGIATLIAVLSGFILKGYKRRLETVEEKMGQAVTKHEVEMIVDKVQDRFREEHKGLFDKIESVHKEIRTNKQEIREDIRELREALTTKYAGPNRRRQ